MFLHPQPNDPQPRRRGCVAFDLSLRIFIVFLFLVPVASGSDAVLLFEQIEPLEEGTGITLSQNSQAVSRLLEEQAAQEIELPVSVSETMSLQLERFDVLSPSARFYIDGNRVDRPNLDVAVYRGKVASEPESQVFLALSGSGLVNGYISIPGSRPYFVATAAESVREGVPIVTVHPAPVESEDAESEFICGLTDDLILLEPEVRAETPTVEAAGVRVARLGIEGDQAFVNTFGNLTAAQEYVVQLTAAISDIYERDLNVKLLLTHISLWPGGGEPFDAADLYGFTDWVRADYDFEHFDLIHLWSSRNGLGYSGIAWVGGTCGDWGVGIEGKLTGSFPLPVVSPDRWNWDLYLVAHEMGHNFGSFHTHSYDPPIDLCFNSSTVPNPMSMRSTLMGYCDIWPGTGLNVDIRFHSRVQEVIEAQVASGGCHWYDCNDNGVEDDVDISEGFSLDVNSNGIPDECEDCNTNGILDPQDILNGMPDVNGNGIPDECEPDCNDNSVPDEWEVVTDAAPDLDGNNVPDECDPDCNGNGRLDWDEILSALVVGSDIDVDRNGIIDMCEDCNGNYVQDWIELERQHNVFVAVSGNSIREYDGASGVIIGRLASGLIGNPYDVDVGPDRKLYLASFGNDNIVRSDPATGGSEELIPPATGGLDGPTAVLIRNTDGLLFVASSVNDCILRFDASSGAFVDTFVTPGLGGLDNPHGMVFGPNDNLFVGSQDNAVREYSGTDGSFVGEFVSPGSGGLNGPRGMVFHPNGNLLVASFGTDAVLEYDGVSGVFVGQFNDDWPLNGPWGMKYSNRGSLFVVANNGAVLEYDLETGHPHHRNFITGDALLIAPTGLAVMPPSSRDCNQNGFLDSCDITSGYSQDLDVNGVPDECEVFDIDEDGVPDSLDNCPTVANSGQPDSDGDGAGDECDLCSGYDDSADIDRDGTPDGCDVCDGYGDYADADSDGVPDGCDRCEGYDDAVDADGDGVADPCDMCPGSDDNQDVDQDGRPDDCDTCQFCEGRILLDHVDGLLNTDTLMGNTPIVFHLRLRTRLAGQELWTFQHSFRLYSEDGAVWQPIIVDTASIDWQAAYGPGSPSFSVYVNPSPGSDEFGIAGSSVDPETGLSESFDEIFLTVATSIDNSQHGKSVCLDSTSDQWLWQWMATFHRTFYPLWEGPYCFEIVSASCCRDITGNVDADPDEIVDIGDLTALIDFLFISFEEPECMDEANIDGEGPVDIGDLTSLIDFLFIGFTPPAACP
ncbi:MAG: thrombospondin type 3 repeat-containing protein [Candidatus Zixiibacteriota bacterium]|nr:MAG: thrombospondin type 3 repeat-containing protein [candidate division Zixibacteria bacterium]